MKFSLVSILFLAMLCLTSCKSVELFILSQQEHLPDETMIENFKTNRAGFERLVAMISEDKTLVFVNQERTFPEDFSPERAAEYRKLLENAGIERGFSVSRENDRLRIVFTTSGQGFVTHSSTKGYVYGDECLYKKLSESLDEMSAATRPFGNGCRLIENNWYLYFSGD